MCTFAEGVKFSCTVSVPSCDEVAPHAVMRYALNAATVKKTPPCQYLMRIYSWRWVAIVPLFH